MDMIEVLGIAASLSLLAGWRLYLSIFATGLAMQAGLIAVPDHAGALALIGNPWIIGAAGLGLLAEFLADKIAWFDSLWDMVHTVLRPVGGALLALAVLDPADPKVQIAALLMGGGGALISHGAKAGTRALINASPEPFSNIAVSTGEDIVSGGLLFLIFKAPIAAALVAGLLLIGMVALLSAGRRMLNRLFTPPAKTPPGGRTRP
ncbi:MAG: DUF4126 domain-containing protein [Chakrabartia sp.]